MRKIIQTKKEIFYPLGFLEEGKKSSIFVRTDKNPEKIFLLANHDIPLHFSKNKKNIIFASSLTEHFSAEKIAHIVSAKIGKRIALTFLYKIGKTQKLFIADHKGGQWWIHGPISTITERGGIVSDFLHNDLYVLYYGESSIHAAISKNAKTWTKYKEPVLRSRPGFFDHGHLKFIASRVCERGILIFYDASVKSGDKIHVQIGAALVSALDPKKVIWRVDTPLFENEISYEADHDCIGALFSDEMISIYWHSEKDGITSSSTPLPFGKYALVKPFDKIKRSKKNPIIAPEPASWWRSASTLNPAAINIDGTIHLLFRAMGADGISRIGYAKSADGIHVDEIYPEPVFALAYSEFGLRPVEKKYDRKIHSSGGSWGGCEDQRMVRIDDRIYVTFNAFDNWNNIRIGMISISVEDFLKKAWDWSEMKFISPLARHKNWVLFPEKIQDKYALFHNLHAENSDQVLIEYFDDINTIGIRDQNFRSPDPQLTPNRPIAWHMRMRSPGASPIKTKDGWLLFYQAHDRELDRYKIGAMLLDLDNPKKIIARSSVPILVPDMWYENEWKLGIVYVCGTVIKDDQLFIYYGGGDKHVCVATVPLDELLLSLKNSRTAVPIINKVIIS